MATDVTPATFRTNFPAFADVTKYPDAQIQFWITYADTLLYDLVRWSTMRDYGIQLIVAHQLTLAGRDAASGQAGSVLGPASSKSVGGVSVSYDTTSAILSNGGYWNLSSFGIQFWQLAMLVGIGGFQL